MNADVQTLFGYVREHHPNTLASLNEARAIDEARFDRVAAEMVRWARGAWGDDVLPKLVDGFVTFTYEINVSQARYERAGHYEHSSFAKVYELVYGNREKMDAYIYGDYFTNLLWPHQLEILKFYEERYLDRFSGNEADIVEIAPGHGFWGLWALTRLPDATLRAYDVSPSSVEIAQNLARAAGLQERATHATRDALDLSSLPEASADTVVSCFLLEHLEQPQRLFDVVSHLLRPRGVAFVSGALTAAAEDHIYEFKRESEIFAMAEQAGLRVLETVSVNPSRTFPRAKYLPRSMGLVVQKRQNDIW